MSKKLDELKKQAAEIAEQIKKLEAESPEERLLSIVRQQIGAASMCWEFYDLAGVFDSGRANACADEIMEAVNEYIAGLIVASDKQVKRIAELEKELNHSQALVNSLSAALDAVAIDQDRRLTRIPLFRMP